MVIDSNLTKELRLGWIPVRGESMWPSLRDGDWARLDPPNGMLQAGDIVVARFDRRFVIHRVVRATEESVLLRGDNCGQDDPEVPIADILGRVSEVRRRRSRLSGSRWDFGPTWTGRFRLALAHGLRRLYRMLRPADSARRQAEPASSDRMLRPADSARRQAEPASSSDRRFHEV